MSKSRFTGNTSTVGVAMLSGWDFGNYRYGVPYHVGNQPISPYTLLLSDWINKLASYR